MEACPKVSPLIISVLLLLGSMSCSVRNVEHGNPIIVDSLLGRVGEMLSEPLEECLMKLPRGMELSSRINPFYLRGDFNGDERPDYVFLVQRNESDGFAFCFAENPEPTWLGAGEEFHEMTSLDFDDWSVYPWRPVVPGVEAGDPPTLDFDGLFLLWSERASALVYWTGSEFAWYQQGD